MDEMKRRGEEHEDQKEEAEEEQKKQKRRAQNLKIGRPRRTYRDENRGLLPGEATSGDN